MNKNNGIICYLVIFTEDLIPKISSVRAKNKNKGNERQNDLEGPEAASDGLWALIPLSV